MFKKIIICLLSVCDLYFAYGFISYLIQGIISPKIVGEKITYFMGMYILSIVYFIVFVIVLTIILVLVFKKNCSKQHID